MMVLVEGLLHPSTEIRRETADFEAPSQVKNSGVGWEVGEVIFFTCSSMTPWQNTV